MSDNQTIWLILWDHAAQSRPTGEPFEVDGKVAEVAKALNVSEADARRRIISLIGELGRLSDGKQFFTLEGSAIVPLPEFLASPKDRDSALAAYPYEL